MTDRFAFTYWPARKAWNAVCKQAGIYGAAIHDARHTFAVHAAQDGVPEARLQKLLGHAHPGTIRRYAMHAPDCAFRLDPTHKPSHNNARPNDGGSRSDCDRCS